MKKKIFDGIVILAIAAVATFNINLSSQENKLSGIALANIEALASGEWTGDGWTCFINSYDDYSSGLFFTYIRCFDCYTSSAVSVWNPSICRH
ncbi:NVEALA domain-containing protein [Parabacteroides sp. Marseille-P3160]|uniref:NVEALA domain-containing protein n=1 Tax=Parabacteroides sp. Marseille-P3160 TaxID=1917887 RepID=UPI0009BB7EDC|nr:NVEALA domain-containing protein [Parabacteroides sp. Marseille-P3160]